MRNSLMLAMYAQFGAVVVLPAPHGQLWFGSAFVFALFAFFAIGHVAEQGWNEPPEVTRGKPPLGWVIVMAWTACPPIFALAVGGLFTNQSWGPVPVLVVCLGSYVLSIVVRVRENRAIAALVQPGKERSEPAPEAALPTPKLVGLPAHAPVPPGRSPVYVHRPAGCLRDHLVDYRVHVDGALIGTVGAGEAFLVCLAPGGHTVQGWINGYSSPPLAFHARADVPLHLTLEPGGPDAKAMADQRRKSRKRGGYLRLTEHHDGPQETRR